MKELVVISGKGGTGKTSVVASFASLAEKAVVVNKAGLNEEVTRNLEELARERGIAVVGRIPYDPAVTRAQIARKTVVEASDGPAAQAIRSLWAKTQERLHLSLPAAVGGLAQLATSLSEGENR